MDETSNLAKVATKTFHSPHRICKKWWPLLSFLNPRSRSQLVPCKQSKFPSMIYELQTSDLLSFHLCQCIWAALLQPHRPAGSKVLTQSASGCTAPCTQNLISRYTDSRTTSQHAATDQTAAQSVSTKGALLRDAGQTLLCFSSLDRNLLYVREWDYQRQQHNTAMVALSYRERKLLNLPLSRKQTASRW